MNWVWNTETESEAETDTTTETELSELKLRVEDAINSTKSAIASGITEGGGMGYIRCWHKVEKTIVGHCSDTEIGYNIVINSLLQPFIQILENAGEEDYKTILASILADKESLGYDADTGKLVNMYKSGIIDPTKVSTTAIKNACSIAKMILTTKVIVANTKEGD